MTAVMAYNWLTGTACGFILSSLRGAVELCIHHATDVITSIIYI